MNNDQAIEQEIQAKGLTAPRITPDDIEANIMGECYFTADQGRAAAVEPSGRNNERGYFSHPGQTNPLCLLTFCVLVLRNGFTVTGESACASPENFDAEIGRKVARQKAVEKIWPLMGYELRSKLSRKPTSDDEYRMQLKDIPLTVIADFVDDSDSIKGMISTLRED